jgi:hypothetical protein
MLGETAKCFCRFVRYWLGAAPEAINKARGMNAAAKFLCLVAAPVFAILAPRVASDYSLVAQKAVNYASYAAFGLVVLYLFWVPFSRHEALQARLDLERQELKKQIQTLSSEKAQRDAEVPRLKLTFQKDQQTWFKQDACNWLCRVRVKNTSNSKNAEGVRVKVVTVVPHKFPINALPSYLVRKGSSGPNGGTIDSLGPQQDELFDFYQWNSSSDIWLRMTDSHGHCVKLNNRTDFPDGECVVLLQASGSLAPPVQMQFKLRWNGQEVEPEILQG